MKFKLLVASFFIINVSVGQEMFKWFGADDFARRRARVLEQIGDGVAIMQGADEAESYIKFRQDNNFYYLTGVEIPGTVLILNGNQKRSTLVVPDQMSNNIKAEAWIKATDSFARIYKVDNILSMKWYTQLLTDIAGRGQPLYINSAPEETTEMSRDRCQATQAREFENPWDGRLSKEATFINRLKERFPLAVMRDLAPILDAMRWVKDDKEVAALRECGRIGAVGFDEAMRVTRPGIYEYQVVAACDFIYQDEGAQCPAYFAIAASGERGLSWHYNANNHKLQSGDVILLDYAPDFNYYVTDITRTWPVSGKFSGDQLKMYNCLKEAHEAVIAAMKPGITIESMKTIAKNVYVKNGMGKYWLNYIGHFVGMSVHDVGPWNTPFVKGVVFNVEPIIEDEGMKIHLRLEDTIVITDTGAENLTKLTTTSVEGMYKLIKEKGVRE
ncbi:MAG: Xaa-Pro peptidase family protein [Ferruginibacter sp.]